MYVGIFYLSPKFELDQFTNNVDLLSDRIHHMKHKNTNRQSDCMKLILSPYTI